MIKVMMMHKSLFVILMISIFVSGCTGILQSQTDQDQQNIDLLKKQALDQKISGLKQDIDGFCKRKCPEKGSILAQSVEYCLSYYSTGSEEMDLDGDGTVNGIIAGLSEDTLFCEDKIFCPAYYDCMGISASDCTGIILQYFAETVRLDDIAEIRRRLSHPEELSYEDELVLPGSCYGRLSESQKQKHWFSKLIE
jgi:hypothetical protein